MCVHSLLDGLMLMTPPASSSSPSKSSWSSWGSSTSSKGTFHSSVLVNYTFRVRCHLLCSSHSYSYSFTAGTPRPFANGVATKSTIASGSAFAGRSVGGGTRSNVYGSRCVSSLSIICLGFFVGHLVVVSRRWTPFPFSTLHSKFRSARSLD